MLRRYLCRILALAALAAPLTPARAAVWYVDAASTAASPSGTSWATAFKAIQPALETAQSGDEVWVAGGTYRESLTFRRPDVALYGGFQGIESSRILVPSEWSILDPDAPAGPLVVIPPGAPGSVVNGMNVVWGQETGQPGIVVQATGVRIAHCSVLNCGGWGVYGGGIVCMPGSSAEIVENSISNNRARHGAGILVDRAAATIRDNQMSWNEAGQATEGRLDYRLEARGGAIAVHAPTAPVAVSGNRISFCSARDGGGLWAENATLTITRNRFESNTASRESLSEPNRPVSSNGGGLAVVGGSASIRNNLFQQNSVYAEAPLSTGNIARAQGGGIALLGAGGTVSNNSFLSNQVVVTGDSDSGSSATSLARGGGLYSDSFLLVGNNLLAYNVVQAVAKHGYATDGHWSVPSSVRPIHNITYENLPTDYYVVLSPLDGNISADPNVDYQGAPQGGSVAINRGESGFVQPGDLDLSGAPRIQGARVDIGAFEYRIPAPPPSRVYVSPAGSDANDGSSWTQAKRTVQDGALTVGIGGEVWVAAGEYPESVVLYSGTAVYGGFQGIETRRDPRDLKTNVTTMISENAPPVFIIPPDTEQVTVDGFTIRNSQRVSYGGSPWSAVDSAGRDVVIAHCRFTDCEIDFGEDNPTAGGAGLFVANGSIAIHNNVFLRNRVAVGQGMTFPQFGNLAGAYGGAVFLRDAIVSVRNNVFLGNSVSVSGAISQYEPLGGALYGVNITGTITNNTFAGNSTTPGGSVRWREFGGSVFLADSNVTLANNIAASNGSGIAVLNGSVSLRHNLVFSNPEGDYAGVTDPTGANGNLRADPLFANLVDSDVHIRLESPARNAGTTSLVTVGETDMDGEPRVAEGIVDIGADEIPAPPGPDLADAVRALRLGAGFTPWLNEDNRLDKDASGRVDIADAVLLLREALGRG